MKKYKREIISGTGLLMLFCLWTVMVITADVRNVGVNGTKVGLASINLWCFEFFGVDFTLYHITDWLGLVPVFVGFSFATAGLVQLIKRRSFFKVDADIIILGVYFVAVAALYLGFEKFVINFRPVLIDGRAESSYPSSTTLLVLTVMLAFAEQINRRLKALRIKRILLVAVTLFSVFMVAGRLISGVHWFTDIAGSVILSFGLFYIYKGVVSVFVKADSHKEESGWNSEKNFRV